MRFDDCQTDADVKMRFRRLASENHPDRAGGTSGFDLDKLKKERDRRLAELSVCPVCQGSKLVRRQIGFRFTYMRCHKCSPA